MRTAASLLRVPFGLVSVLLFRCFGVVFSFFWCCVSGISCGGVPSGWSCCSSLPYCGVASWFLIFLLRGSAVRFLLLALGYSPLLLAWSCLLTVLPLHLSRCSRVFLGKGYCCLLLVDVVFGFLTVLPLMWGCSLPCSRVFLGVGAAVGVGSVVAALWCFVLPPLACNKLLHTVFLFSSSIYTDQSNSQIFSSIPIFNLIRKSCPNFDIQAKGTFRWRQAGKFGVWTALRKTGRVVLKRCCWL
ncbi:hypothetical protein LXL04_033075 [Taraxacum kok-saghyz]